MNQSTGHHNNQEVAERAALGMVATSRIARFVTSEGEGRASTKSVATPGQAAATGAAAVEAAATKSKHEWDLTCSFMQGVMRCP